MSLTKKIINRLGFGAELTTTITQTQLADIDADFCEQVPHLDPKLAARAHPIYSDGSLVLIGDQVRSHNLINGSYYEGEVIGVCSTSVLCLPTLDLTIEDGVCDLLYVVHRSPETQASQMASLELARVKLARGEYLGPSERAALLEAVSRHTSKNER